MGSAERDGVSARFAEPVGVGVTQGVGVGVGVVVHGEIGWSSSAQLL